MYAIVLMLTFPIEFYAAVMVIENLEIGKKIISIDKNIFEGQEMTNI